MEWSSFTMGAMLACVMTFGIIALPAAAIMRRQFLLWIALRMALAGLMALTFPPACALVFGPGHICLLIRTVSTDIAVGAIGPILATYIERDIALPHVRRALWLMLPAGLVLALFAPSIAIYGQLDWLHDGLLLAMIVNLAVALVLGIRAGSRAARYQAVAWVPGIAIAVLALGWELVMNRTMPFYFQIIVLAVLFECIVTTVGVVDEFMHIQHQRDKAIEDVRVATRDSTHDPLTGIANRRGLMRHFHHEDHGIPSGIAIIDCDHFKRINDNFGHDVGDAVLIAVAEALNTQNCFAGRLGGEEFMLLIYGKRWQHTAETVRRAITSQVRKRVPEIPFPVTASAGLAAMGPSESLAMAMKRADRALYAAKNAGRDRSLALTEFEPSEVWMERLA